MSRRRVSSRVRRAILKKKNQAFASLRGLESSPRELLGRRADRVNARMVLIIEDDDLLRELLDQSLRDAGFSTSTAKNGSEALSMLARTKTLPSLIVLDLVMPRMNGWLFRSRQLQDRRLAKIPVCVLSGADEALPVAQATLRKPFDVAALIETAERLTTR